jgi:hypothetical protein
MFVDHVSIRLTFIVIQFPMLLPPVSLFLLFLVLVLITSWWCLKTSICRVCIVW